MGFYIIIANDIDLGTARLSARDLCMSRIAKSTWPLNRGTANRGKIRTGDWVIFYLAGLKEGMFIGTASLSSGAFVPSSSEKQDMMIADDECLGSEFIVRFEKTEIFGTPVNVRTIMDKLEYFYGAGKRWGVKLQGGIKQISAKDYNTIIQSARRC